MTHYLAICPGFHAPELTDRTVACLDLPTAIVPIIIPTDRLLPWDPVGIARHLTSQITHTAQPSEATQLTTQLSFLGFSAGTVGALGAAWLWRDRARLGAIILCDGWGVPIIPPWLATQGPPACSGPPIYRLSHDRWTHDTWQRMGEPTPSFVADPDVAHLTLWHEPDRVWGTAISPSGAIGAHLSAKDYICQCISMH